MKSNVVRNNGTLKISVDGKLYVPLSFKSFRPNPKNISEFYDAGIRLFSVLTSGITSALGVPYSLFGESWIGENEYDFSAIDKQMEMFIENAPDAYFAPMIQLDTRDWYLKLHPEVPNSFTHLSQIACDEKWKKAAAEYMKKAILHIEEKYGDRVYGYFLLGGNTTEWLSNRDYEESNSIKEAGYKKWMKCDNATLPSLEELNRTGNVFLDKDEENVYNARRFHNELIADLILYFAGEAQSVLNHSKLLGVYYGYLFELGGESLYNYGGLAYEKVYLSEDIDMISSPSAYGYRRISDPSAFMVTQKTLDAHNKIYFLEFDHITHTAPEEIPDGLDKNSENIGMVKIPGADSKCKNETESINLMYRDFMLCNANMAALWWFDMFDGWFRSESMMAAIKHMIEISEDLTKSEIKSAAKIAVFAEGESMYRVRKSSKIATVCLSDIRRTLAECGAAYDVYSISDIFLPQAEEYNLYVFVNQYDLSRDVKNEITLKCKKKGKAALWLYAPDYANGGACNVNNITDITGISVCESDISHGGICFDGKVTQYDTADPYFEIQDTDAEPLCFFEDGTVAAAYKETDGFKSIYAATCNIPSALLRSIAKLTNTFIYSENQYVYVYPNSACVGVYNATDHNAEIHLPQDGEYCDLIHNRIFECKNGILTVPKDEIKAFLLIKV